MKSKSVIIALGILTIFLGCVSSPQYKTGKPQFRWFTSEGYVLESTVGWASYYGEEFAGRPTASGEIFNPNALTAAHKTYPFGTIVKITNLNNNKSVIVKINDRGPFIQGRIIDLSRAAAGKIDMIVDGVVKVKLEVLEWGESK